MQVPFAGPVIFAGPGLKPVFLPLTLPRVTLPYHRSLFKVFVCLGGDVLYKFCLQ